MLIDRLSKSFHLLRLFASIGLVAFAAPISAGSYSEGMEAYMSGNYERAKSLWMRGARDKDSKSMFNLGLMNEQGLLQGASFAEAQRWYRLAGQNGYPAADYHLGQLLRNAADSKGQSQILLQRAADQGYVPAQRVLQTGSEDTAVPEPRAADINTQPLTSVPTRGEYLGNAWIAAQPTQHWTIQLVTYEDVSKIHQYIDKHGLRDSAAYFSDGSQFKLVYGSYPAKELASSARQSMPARLKDNGPWLRSLTSVQQIISGQ